MTTWSLNIPALGIGYSETKIVECFDFFSAIASGKQPSPNFEDGYRTERVADALIESGAARGKIVLEGWE